MKRASLLLGILVLFSSMAVVRAADKPLRIGLIGLDTSHCVAFTKLLNNEEGKGHVAGGRVVAAFAGGSDDIESSYGRVDRFTAQMQDELGVKIVSTIEELCQQVDVVMLTSVDGRKHLEQARPVIAAGLPLYIDKPMAGSLKEVIEIFTLAKAAGVPVFSSSSYRYYPGLVSLMEKDIGELKGAISYGPAHLEETHQDLAWYAIHPLEALFTAMGTGLESVVRVHTDDTDVVTGVWSGGKVGTLRGLRNAKQPNKVIVFGTKGVAEQGPGAGYRELLVKAIEFFQTGKSPVPPQETIEIFAFVEAADLSREQGGAPINIAELLKKSGYTPELVAE